MPCHDLIANSDIELIYESSSHVDDANLSSYCETSDKKTVAINLLKSTVAINKQPIGREYYRNASLRSNESQGKIVVNKLLILKDRYRGKNITKEFHKKELEIYAANGFTEIQLEAAWNGITHWANLDFEFYMPDKCYPILYTLWSSFFMEGYVLPQKKKLDILIKYTNYALIPRKYKKGFGAWLINNNKNTAFPMYKVLG